MRGRILQGKQCKVPLCVGVDKECSGIWHRLEKLDSNVVQPCRQRSRYVAGVNEEDDGVAAQLDFCDENDEDEEMESN